MRLRPQPRRPRTVLRRPRLFRPHLEVLEDRWVPSTVTNLLDNGPGSLRQAILDTPAGGTVDFRPGLSGTITLTTGELLINKDLTIAGPGAGAITVSGNHASLVFRIQGPDFLTSTTAAISGLTITQGEGGISVGGSGVGFGSTLTVSNCTISDNSARFDGGGIANSYSTLTVSNCTISDNFAPGGTSVDGGGGIYNYYGSLTVTNSTLSGSSTFKDGGGIYSEGTGAVTIVTSSTLSGNSAILGGGIANVGGALTVTSSTISGNSYNGIYNDGTATVTASTISGHFGSGGILNVDGALTVRDSTVSGNSAVFRGGGIYNQGFGRVTVTGSTISGNSADEGGGIFSSGDMLTVSDSTVSGNSATGSGGGIDSYFGTVTVTGSTLSGNSANGGAGIYNSGTLTVSNSTLSGNSAAGSGGGIDNYFGTLTVSDSTVGGNSATVTASNGLGGGGISNSGTLTITASTVSGNTANIAPGGLGGGGIFNSGTLTITGCTLSDNSDILFGIVGHAYGGGIYNSGSGVLTVNNSTLSGNSASTIARPSNLAAGGGIYNASGAGPVTVTNSTFSGNSASASFGDGGGISNAGPLTIGNTIVAGNTAPSSPDVSGSLTSLGHNLIGDGTGGSGYDATDLVGTAASPIDPKLGPLQDNGGPTQTMALLLGSPAIDAGDNALAPGPYDQRDPGFPRIVNGVIDIGAFEVQAAPSVQGVAVNDGSAQRSLVTSVTVTFNGVVSFDAGAFVVQRQGQGPIPVNVTTSVVGNQTVAVLTFGGDSVINGSLPDGDYTLTVLADHVHDPSGQTLAADSVTSFFRLFGDSNGNGVIDLQDLARFASAYGKSAGDPGYLAYFDYYGDGRVGFNDLIQLLLRLGKRV